MQTIQINNQQVESYISTTYGDDKVSLIDDFMIFIKAQMLESNMKKGFSEARESIKGKKVLTDDYGGKNGEEVPANAKSDGVNGDGVKLAGSHPEKSIDKHNKLKPKEIEAPFGGSHKGKRLFNKQEYPQGGIVDNTLEAFAGPHDFMSSWNYENIDGTTYLKSDSEWANIGSGALLFPSVPFAIAPAILNNINTITNIKNAVEYNNKKQGE